MSRVVADDGHKGDFYGSNLQNRIYETEKLNNPQGNTRKGGRVSLGVSKQTMKQTLSDYGDARMLRELQLDDTTGTWTSDSTIEDLRAASLKNTALHVL